MEDHFGFPSEDTSMKNERPAFSNHTRRGRTKEAKGTRFPKSLEDKKKQIKIRKEQMKRKNEKKRRLIIRNLSFKIDENMLRKAFSKFGEISDLVIPKKPNGQKRGFAFVQYSEFKSTIHAIKNLNYQDLYGRPIAVDYAIAKDKYEHMNSSKVVSKPSVVSTKEVESSSDSDQSIHEENEDLENEILPEADDPKEKKVHQFLKEFDEGRESEVKEEIGSENDASPVSSSENEESDSESDEDGDHHTPLKTNNSKSAPKNSTNDVSEGKTVFVRNISFETGVDVLKEAMEEFGPVKYCVLCIDPLTEYPRGTAFVKFENKEDAEKVVAKSSDDSSEGIYLDGRRLYSSLAVSRDELKEKVEEGKKKGKDKRNLALLNEGQVRKNSYEAEGVSESDLAKRYKLEMMKKNKLKNLQFFVSNVRLCVHNIPPTLKDSQFRQIFKDAVGPKAKITEVRIMRNLQKLTATGEPQSKGHGFVTFTQHEDALQALRKINNNPDVFTSEKRPIVEFSVENRTALRAKEQRKERSRMKMEKNVKHSATNDSKDEINEPKANKNKERSYNNNEKRKRFNNGRKQKTNAKLQPNAQEPSAVKEKKQNKKQRKKVQGKPNCKMDGGSFSKLVNSYKEKLLSKME